MKKILASSVVAFLLLTGCSSSDTGKSSGGQNAAPVMTYKMGSSDWSSVEAYGAKEKVKEAYQFAVEHPEVLNNMPCYCGCGESDGHTSNTDCFVDKVEDNVAILDNMGLG